ncbi:MAG: hypothetical protein AABY00_00705 [Nanoarchaeota archaeon]
MTLFYTQEEEQTLRDVAALLIAVLPEEQKTATAPLKELLRAQVVTQHFHHPEEFLNIPQGILMLAEVITMARSARWKETQAANDEEYQFASASTRFYLQNEYALRFAGLPSILQEGLLKKASQPITLIPLFKFQLGQSDAFVSYIHQRSRYEDLVIDTGTKNPLEISPLELYLTQGELRITLRAKLREFLK